MTLRRVGRVWLGLGFVAWLGSAACSTDKGTPFSLDGGGDSATGTGGRAGTGGGASGGATGSGGASASGGATASGGRSGETGGTMGAAGAGGRVGSGGGTAGAAGGQGGRGNETGGAMGGGGRGGASGAGGGRGGAPATGGRGGGGGNLGNGGAGGSTMCGGLAGRTCPAERFCQLAPGTCRYPDAAGTCAVRPDVCPANYAPVCGCNGTTYSNDCVRQGAGVSKLSDGACNPSGCPMLEPQAGMSCPSPTLNCRYTVITDPTCFQSWSCGIDLKWGPPATACASAAP